MKILAATSGNEAQSTTNNNTMLKTRLDIKEYDEAGNLVATYIQSTSKRSVEDAVRVDVVVGSRSLFIVFVHVLVQRSHIA
jgi:hypothetical protein